MVFLELRRDSRDTTNKNSLPAGYFLHVFHVGRGIVCLFINSSVNALKDELGVIILQTRKEDLKLNLKKR